MDLNPRIKLPAEIQKGEVFVIKTLVTHPMENGRRKDADGSLIPRKIINLFTCKFNGQPVFEAKLDTAVSTNPYIEFYAKVAEAGTFAFAWTDDDGTVTMAEQKVTLKG